jgi:hypothetical protein
MTATGKPQVFAEKCSTCIFRPGNLMHLRPGRMAEVIGQNRDEGTVLICHKTTYGQHPEIGETMCRGYLDAYGSESNVVRVMERLTGGSDWYVEVPPPPD